MNSGIEQSYDFKAVMRQRLGQVEAQLGSYISEEGLPEDRLPQAMLYSLLAGGKRVRPLLTMAAADACGLAPEQAVGIGCAIEMLHAYSLVHDDLPAMDDSDLRRGKLSAHKAFDEATAILAGDALQALVFEVLAAPQTHPDPSVRANLCYTMAKAAGCQGMAGGQMLDLLAENIPNLDLDSTTRLQARKTGALISYSLEAGGIAGKASKSQMSSLRAYGDALGLCFQITDDLLDHQSDAQTLGKPTGQDQNAGKVTFITHFGLEGAQAKASALTEQAQTVLLGNKEFDIDKIQFLLHLAQYVLTRTH